MPFYLKKYQSSRPKQSAAQKCKRVKKATQRNRSAKELQKLHRETEVHQSLGTPRSMVDETGSHLPDSVTSFEQRFCLQHQPESCHKGQHIKIYCLKDERWKRIMLTGNRMRKFDNQEAWYNYKSVRPLPKEKKKGSVDLTRGTRWVV